MKGGGWETVANACDSHGLELTNTMPLGKGGYSIVWKATDLCAERTYAARNGTVCGANGGRAEGPEEVALKVTRAADLENEIEALEDLGQKASTGVIEHDGIVALHRTFAGNEEDIVDEDDSDDSDDDLGNDKESMYLVMELLNGGSLYKLVKERRHLPEDEARHNIVQILRAVDNVHKGGWVHRDLKLENVIIHSTERADGSVRVVNKLIDFGFAVRQEAGSTVKGVLGTAHYAAPEMVLQDQSGYDGRAADMFAVGVMLYVMLYGAYPFEERGKIRDARGRPCGVRPWDDGHEYKEIFREEVDPSVDFVFGKSPHKPSTEAEIFILRLIAPKPEERLTAEAALLDPWAKGVNEAITEEQATWHAALAAAEEPGDD
jgi:serine/threonine-protein kinase SRK2